MSCIGIALAMACLGLSLASAQTSGVTVCPSLRAWTPQFQDQLAAELPRSTLPAVRRAAIDAVADRQIVKACK